MILVCGEALLDLVQVDHSDGPPMLRALPGGGPANTAIAAARLGESVLLVTRVGTDAGGDLVCAHLRRSGVDDRLVVRASEPTTLALVTLAESGDARYAFYFESTAGWAWRRSDLPVALPDGVNAVHLGSMALAAPPGYDALSDFVSRVHEAATISLDPNVRLGVVGDLAAYRAALESLAGRCHLVRASEEDLAALYPGLGTPEALARLAALGPRCVVATRGAAAPLARVGDETIEGPERAVRVVDTVGAGDTFSAALLHVFARQGLLASRLEAITATQVAEALSFAAAAASITCERQGADPPTADEVARRLATS